MADKIIRDDCDASGDEIAGDCRICIYTRDTCPLVLQGLESDIEYYDEITSGE